MHRNITILRDHFAIWKPQAQAIWTPGTQKPLSPNRSIGNHPWRCLGQRRQRGTLHQHNRQARKRLLEGTAGINPRDTCACVSRKRNFCAADCVLHRSAPAQPLKEAHHSIADQRQRDEQQWRHIEIDHAVFDEKPLRRKKIPHCQQNSGKGKAQDEKGQYTPHQGAPAAKAKCSQRNPTGKAQLPEQVRP